MDEPVSKTISQKYKNSANWHLQTSADVFDHKWTPLTKHVVQPKFQEIERNPRSRSAKLRIATKNIVEMKKTVNILV